MSLCRHHIIANSSSSWRGAWLGRNPGRIVIAPDRWFTDPAIDTNDRMPETRIRIERQRFGKGPTGKHYGKRIILR